MSLQPATYAEALERAQNRPQKPRKPLKASKAGLSRKRSLGAKGTKGRTRRAKMPSRKSLVRKADGLVSLIVRLRDGGRCVLYGINSCCTGGDRLQCGHIYGRRSHGARFDVEPDGNCHAQCANCNKKHNSHQWIYYRWYIGRFGQEAFDAMYVRWSRGRKYSRLELIALCAELQAKLTELQEQKENTNGT